MQNSQLKYRSRFIHIKATNVLRFRFFSFTKKNELKHSEFVEFILHEYRINSNASLSDLSLFSFLLFSTSRDFFVVVRKKTPTDTIPIAAMTTIYDYQGIWFGYTKLNKLCTLFILDAKIISPALWNMHGPGGSASVQTTVWKCEREKAKKSPNRKRLNLWTQSTDYIYQWSKYNFTSNKVNRRAKKYPKRSLLSLYPIKGEEQKKITSQIIIKTRRNKQTKQSKKMWFIPNEIK